MATPLRVLIDLNVVLDALGSREPFAEIASEVLGAAESKHIEGYIAAHSLTTFYYLTAKFRSPAIAHAQLVGLLQFLKVAAVDEQVIEQALSLLYKDFEDAVQMVAGMRAGVEYVVTRDLIGFKSGPLPVLTPVELLVLLQSDN